MQPLTPEQATFLLQSVYLPALKNEHRITKSIIEAVPTDKGDFRPDGISKSALDLAYHTVATEMVFMKAVATGEFAFGGTKPESIHTSADLSAWYEKQFEAAYESLTKLTSEQLTKIIDFRGMFQLPAVSYLGFLLHHSVHHRGQLTMYLRPMGAKVPSIYGESYDAAQARQSAQSA